MARLCGYLPLAIGMLASQLRHHPAWSAEQLAARLATARDRLPLMRAEDVSVAAAFELSYADLTPGEQRLFRRLGLVPGPSVDGYAAAALDGTGLDQARRHLEELYDQHLIGEPEPGRYQLHDLLREHARGLAADDPADSDAATERLLDYYLHTALAADRLVPLWDTAYRPRPVVSWPGDAPDLPTLAHAAGWLEAERPNLHAAADHAAATGRHLHAVHIPAAMGGFLRERGYWDEAVTLHQNALIAARHAGDLAGQAGTLHELGLMRSVNSDYPAAVASLAQAVALYADGGDLAGQAFALCQLAIVQFWTGDYVAGMASNERALALGRSCGDRRAEACALQLLGHTQHKTGDYAGGAANLTAALESVPEPGSPARRGGSTQQPWRPAENDGRLRGGRRQQPPGPGDLPRAWRPAPAGLGPQRPRHVAATDGGLRRRRCVPPAGPPPVARSGQPARRGPVAERPR